MQPGWSETHLKEGPARPQPCSPGSLPGCLHLLPCRTLGTAIPSGWRTTGPASAQVCGGLGLGLAGWAG